MGQACAVVARGSDPSALFYNPGSCARLEGSSVQVNAGGIMSRTAFTLEAGGPESRMSDDAIPIGSVHATRRAGERLVLGLGLNTPYGSKTEWREDWTGRYYAGVTQLRTLYVAPTAAFELTDALAIGGSVMGIWGEATLDRAINAPLVYAAAVPDLAVPFSQASFLPGNDVWQHLKADDWGFGYRLGVHWQPGDRWSVGAAFQSEAGLDLEGHATYDIPVYDDSDFGRTEQTGQTANQLSGTLFPDTDARSRLELPATATGGVACRLREGLTVEADLAWTGWSAYAAQTVEYASLGGETDVERSIPKRWNDVWSVRLGAEFTLVEKVVGRLGYLYDQTPIPDATRDPSLPGADRHDFTCGIGVRSDRWTLDLAYMHVRMEDSPSELAGDSNGALLGEYESKAHVVAAATTLHF